MLRECGSPIRGEFLRRTKDEYRFKTTRGTVARAPWREQCRAEQGLRAGARGDVRGRAGLVVGLRPDGRLEAVAGLCEALRGDVLDAGVVRGLEHGRRRADVGAVVGVERLQAGHR